MLGVAVMLMVIGACAAADHDTLVLPPPYIQAKTSFARVRLYLQENIPFDEGDIHNKLTRKHKGYGMLAAVTSALVSVYRQHTPNYDPLDIFYETVPNAWVHYNQVASGPVNRILAEASAKIQPVTNLEVSCDPTDSIDECNRIIDRKVRSGSKFLSNRAALLLQLGKVSDILIKKAAHLDIIVARDEAIPYLLNNVATDETLHIVKELAVAIDLLRPGMLTHV